MLKALLIIPKEFFQDVIQALLTTEGVMSVSGFLIDGEGNVHVYVEYYDDVVNTATIDFTVDSLVDDNWYSFWNLHSDSRVM